MITNAKQYKTLISERQVMQNKKTPINKITGKYTVRKNRTLKTQNK